MFTISTDRQQLLTPPLLPYPTPDPLLTPLPAGPSPLIFFLLMFMKGLTQNSVACLVSGGAGAAFGAIVLVLTLGFYGLLVFDMIRFRRMMIGTGADSDKPIKWTSAKPKEQPTSCDDPLMRSRASLQTRLCKKPDAFKDRSSGAFGFSDAAKEDLKEPGASAGLDLWATSGRPLGDLWATSGRPLGCRLAMFPRAPSP